MGAGKGNLKKFGDASLHPRTFTFNLTEECYLFFFFALAFGFALALAFGFAFALAFGFALALAFGFAFFLATAILFSSRTLLRSRQLIADGARAQSQCIVTVENLVKKKVKSQF
ncbi:MAG: hypothetical protein WB819_08475 [Terriglobia bacterium]